MGKKPKIYQLLNKFRIMWYILLSFEGAKIKKEGDNKASSFSDIDIKNPVGLSQLSNMLHVMFGLPPKPLKRKTVFEVNEKIHEIAKKSLIRYTNLPYKEFFMAGKNKYNSTYKINTLIDGETFQGYYTWNYFRMCFTQCKELYSKIMKFFENIIGVTNIPKHYMMKDFIKEFHKHLNDEEVIKFRNENKCLYAGGKGGNPLKQPWWGLLFNEGFEGTNITCFTYTPILNTHGIGKLISCDGEIIVPIEDDSLLEDLGNYGTLPTLLDGGLVNIVSITKTPPYNDMFDTFSPVFLENISM